MAEVEISAACKAQMDALSRLPDFKMSDEVNVKAAIEGLGRIGQEKKWVDKFIAYSLNSYLSGLQTMAVNVLGLATNASLRPLLHLVSAGTDAVGLTKTDKTAREAFHMFMSNFEGLLSDVEFFKAGFFAGRPLDIQTSISAVGRAYGVNNAAARSKVVSAIKQSYLQSRKRAGDVREDDEIMQAFLLERKQNDDWDLLIEEFLDESYDYFTATFKNPYLDKVIHAPTRASVAIDEYAKARYRRMKIVELASKKAAEEAKGNPDKYNELFNKYKRDTLWGLDAKAHRRAKEEGWDEDFKKMQQYFGKLQSRMGETFGKADDDMMPYADMREFTLEHTFQSKLHGVMRKIAQSRDTNPYVGIASALYFPFIKTPWNIVKHGGTFIPVLPLAKRARPSTVRVVNKKEEVIYMSNEEIMARQIVGGAMFLGVMSAVENGYATGSARDARQREEWRAKGIPEQSIRIGDSWYSYAKLEPIATVLGLAADLMEAYKDYSSDINPEKTALEVTMAETLSALKGNIFDKAFLEGWAALFDTVNNEQSLPKDIAERLTRIALPSASNYAARAMDDKERQATTIMEKAQQRIPVLREQLPEDVGAYGERSAKNLASRLTGFDVKDAIQDRVQSEVTKTGASIDRVQGKIKGVKLNNEQLATYRKIANAYTTQALNNVTSSTFYDDLPRSLKARMLEEAARKTKTAAAKQFYGVLMRDDPEFANKWWLAYVESKGLEDVVPLTMPR